MKTVYLKVLIFVLAFSLLLPNINIMASQNAGGFEPGEYNKAISFLMDLSIIDDSTYAKYDASVVMTRGEFASLVIAVMGLSDESLQSDFVQKFDDVSEDTPFAKDINIASSMGIFNGVSETEFSPDDMVTLSQAIKVSVEALGYGELAKYKGGYPAGYINLANETGILDGVVTESFDYALSRGNIIVLMYNTILADFMSITGVSGESYTYEVKEGENLLSYYHKIYEGEGIVTSNWECSISGDRQDANYILINGKRYYTDSPRVVGSVGKNVKYYYKDIGGKDVILSLREENNIVVSIKADSGYTFDFSLDQYTVPGDKTDLKLKLYDYDIIYNGYGINADIPADYEEILTPNAGTITLIDNNEDNIYDVVIIDKPEVLIFKAFNSNNEKVFDVSDQSRDISLDNYTNYEVFGTDGDKVELSKLKPNTVIMVYESYDKKGLKLIICTDTAEGVVSEITDDTIIMNGEELAFSPVSRLDGLNPGQTFRTVIIP